MDCFYFCLSSSDKHCCRLPSSMDINADADRRQCRRQWTTTLAAIAMAMDGIANGTANGNGRQCCCNRCQWIAMDGNARQCAGNAQQ